MDRRGAATPCTTAGLPLEPWSRPRRPRRPGVLGLDDVGAIEPGRRADLVVLDEDLEVVRVMRGGAWLS